MALQFEFAGPGRILFGEGAVRGAGSAAASFGRRAFVVTGRDPSRAAPLLDSLGASELRCAIRPVAGEPDFEELEAALAAAREWGTELVIGCGGGSALDLAKAVAALLANEGPVLDYVEVIGAGKPLSLPSLPCIAVPTTAGTGSEATRNAVLRSRERGVKVSLRSPSMLPRLAIVDPELCYGLPPAATASTGMDALTQLIEPFVCNRPNPLVDALCREGMARAARSLEKACREGQDPEARAELSLASLFSGMALANARLGAVHGFAAPIGGAFGAPHGAVCAALLAPVAAANMAALRSRAPGSPALARYAEVASILRGGSSCARPEDAAPALAELAARIGIKGLSSFGIGRNDAEDMAAKARVSSSMQGNPIPLEDAELIRIFESAL